MSISQSIEEQNVINNIKSYAKLPEVLDIPNLIQVQLDSARWFLEEGLKDLFQEVSPIYRGTRFLLFGCKTWTTRLLPDQGNSRDQPHQEGTGRAVS